MSIGSNFFSYFDRYKNKKMEIPIKLKSIIAIIIRRDIYIRVIDIYIRVIDIMRNSPIKEKNIKLDSLDILVCSVGVLSL